MVRCILTSSAPVLLLLLVKEQERFTGVLERCRTCLRFPCKMLLTGSAEWFFTSLPSPLQNGPGGESFVKSGPGCWHRGKSSPLSFPTWIPVPLPGKSEGPRICEYATGHAAYECIQVVSTRRRGV